MGKKKSVLYEVIDVEGNTLATFDVFVDAYDYIEAHPIEAYAIITQDGVIYW